MHFESTKLKYNAIIRKQTLKILLFLHLNTWIKIHDWLLLLVNSRFFQR